MFTIVTQGSYTSSGASQKISLPSSVDYFKVINYTQMNLTGTVCVGGEWFNGVSAANDGVRWKKAGSNVIQMDLFSTSTASNGFTYVTTSPLAEAAVTGTAITAANPAVVTMTNTYANGDRIRLYGTTGMQQIAGMDFTISSVSGSGFTLLGLDASGFAAAATAVIGRRISTLDAVEPEFLYITKVSKANPCVITVSQAHNYVVGQQIVVQIPPSFGMTQLNTPSAPQSKPWRITAVGTYTITIDVDSSAFTTFAFPASSATPTTQLFATLAPAGQYTSYNPITTVQTGYNFSYAPFHTGQFTPYMLIGGGAASAGGASSDVIIYQAFKMET